ncbi:hypothetical protein B0H67DRAFT_548163 [Lasiosphaeris hirsuta]|uniref:Uncharacterized protein n=1 Tax=Lasiosphaeris hirsuta TaxID=260670 RepID=A0AA40B9J8_9PEZI|nr:hypothetical protein B0H67DRAFT_548163 [Lasiosphaeris hirsuta]
MYQYITGPKPGYCQVAVNSANRQRPLRVCVRVRWSKFPNVVRVPAIWTAFLGLRVYIFKVPSLLICALTYDHHTSPESYLYIVQLLSNATWYLLGSGSWNTCQELLAVAFKACNDKDSVLYAHLLNTSAALNGKRKNTAEALKLYGESKEIRERLLGP